MPSTNTDRIGGLSTSVAIKAPCLYTTTGNITLSGLSVQGNGEWVSELTAGDRVFVRSQTSGVDNGIWEAGTGTWQRAKDFDGARDVVQGTLVSVYRAGADFSIYKLDTANPIVIGTTSLSFSAASDFALAGNLANTSNYTLGVSLVGGAGRVVDSIDQLRDLPETGGSERVFVTGYYEAGDGGGGHYWLDTSDTASTDNGGTIIVATDGGRWKLISAHGVSIAQFGAVGDDSDETAELDAALTWASVSKKTVWFEESKTYRSTQSLVLESPLDLGGSVLKFVVTGTEKCLDVRTNGSVFNGEIELAGSAYSGSGDSGCPIIIGDYGVGTGYENIKISNLTITSNKPSGSNGIMVTGDSNNIEIENITFSDSSTLDRGILIHWGGATTPSSGTYHPYNIKINNIVAKNQTGMSTTSDGIVFVSGAYNVSINGVSGDNVGCGILFYAGDYGTQYAGEAAAFLGKGLSVNNVQLDDVTAYAIYTNGNGSVAGTSYTVPLSINAKNIKATGNGAADGIFLTYCDGSIWENCEMSGFADNGFRVGRRAINGVIKGGKYSGNGNSGVYFYDDTTTPKYWNVEGVEATLNNTGANANPYERAGIAIRSASHIRVSGCKFGDTSETQFYSIRVESAADTVWIERNHTVELAATGVAYSIGASTDYTINPMGSNNTAASGLTVYGGCPLFYIDSAGKKTLSASAAPASGTWAVGDKVWFTAPAAGGAPGAICTTAGTPGTWKNMANLAA